MQKTSLSNDVLRKHHLLSELNDEQLEKIRKTSE